MSLMGIMKLLGHRDYTAISDATVRREYFEALGRIGDRDEIDPELAFAAPEFDPAAALENVSRWISTTLRERAEEKRDAPLVHELVVLVRRLDAIREAVVALRGALGAMA